MTFGRKSGNHLSHPSHTEHLSRSICHDLNLKWARAKSDFPFKDSQHPCMCVWYLLCVFFFQRPFVSIASRWTAACRRGLSIRRCRVGRTDHSIFRRLTTGSRWVSLLYDSGKGMDGGVVVLIGLKVNLGRHFNWNFGSSNSSNS